MPRVDNSIAVRDAEELRQNLLTYCRVQGEHFLNLALTEQNKEHRAFLLGCATMAAETDARWRDLFIVTTQHPARVS